MSNIPGNLKYTEEHEWALVEGNTITVGITDFAQSSLGDIVFVELPEEGTELELNGAFGVVESIKSVSDLYSPISGKVIAKNTDIEETPEKINENAYEAWLIKLEVSNQDELSKLLDADAYQKICEAQG
jgi:glycine cleavage system H protein